MEAIIVLFFWIIATILVVIWAGKLGRSIFLAVIGCVFLSPLIVGIYYLIVGSANKCPHCRAGIPKDATVCRHCGRDTAAKNVL
ncbi:MAG TPA: zinc ribbon domain-containing protein [Candidatus Goldiibacteriota bacterium]|nr:zinc ribbon domain-containing protein [Candidatus Goldiibacteriota bacterium]